MNGWRSRLMLIAVFLFAARVHGWVMEGCPNNPTSLLIYHGSAGAVDLFLLFSAQFFISGRLCDDIQATCIASIVINFAGFCAYMAYAPPMYYNTLVEGLCYGQYLRLLYMGRYDADYRRDSVVPMACRNWA